MARLQLLRTVFEQRSLATATRKVTSAVGLSENKLCPIHGYLNGKMMENGPLPSIVFLGTLFFDKAKEVCGLRS